MISRDSFIEMVNALDEFWGDKIEHLEALGFGENYFSSFADVITEAIEKDIDPKHTARDDEHCYACGAYLCEWLFGTDDFQEVCPDAGALYDYTVAKYQQQKNA